MSIPLRSGIVVILGDDGNYSNLQSCYIKSIAEASSSAPISNEASAHVYIVHYGQHIVMDTASDRF